MITYRETPSVSVTRTAMPEPPFFHATLVRPYEERQTHPFTIDYLDLTAFSRELRETRVCTDVRDQLEHEKHLTAPLLIDATGGVERLYQRGSSALAYCAEQQLAATILISSEGEIPSVTTANALLAIATWPCSIDQLQPLFADARRSGLRWGAVIPIVLTITTELSVISELVTLAAKHGASFVAALPIDLDPTAKREIASVAVLSDEHGEESYAALFGDDLEPLIVSTERHVAALAREHHLLDYVPLPDERRRDNWAAAAYLARIAQRMFRMERDVELAWSLHRSAKLVAELTKPIDRVHAAASLAIIEGLDELSQEILEQWLTIGRSDFGDRLDRDWRLRRDHYR